MLHLLIKNRAALSFVAGISALFDMFWKSSAFFWFGTNGYRDTLKNSNALAGLFVSALACPSTTFEQMKTASGGHGNGKQYRMAAETH